MSDRVKRKRSVPFEKHHRINRLEACYIDRLSSQDLSGVGASRLYSSVTIVLNLSRNSRPCAGDSDANRGCEAKRSVPSSNACTTVNHPAGRPSTRSGLEVVLTAATINVPYFSPTSNGRLSSAGKSFRLVGLHPQGPPDDLGLSTFCRGDCRHLRRRPSVFRKHAQPRSHSEAKSHLKYRSPVYKPGRCTGRPKQRTTADETRAFPDSI